MMCDRNLPVCVCMCARVRTCMTVSGISCRRQKTAFPCLCGRYQLPLRSPTRWDEMRKPFEFIFSQNTYPIFSKFFKDNYLFNYCEIICLSRCTRHWPVSFPCWLMLIILFINFFIPGQNSVERLQSPLPNLIMHLYIFCTLGY